MKCQMDIPKVPGLEEGVLTVGREFLLHCEGQWPRPFLPDTVKLQLPSEDPWMLHLKSFEFRNMSTADLKFISYRVGQIELPDLKVISSEQEVSLGPLKFQVKSVLPPQTQGEAPPAPYAPYGPLDIAMPWLYLFLPLVFVGLFFFAMVSKYREKQRFLRELSEDLNKIPASSGGALQGFHLRMRRWESQSPVFNLPREAKVSMEGQASAVSSSTVPLDLLKKALLDLGENFSFFITQKYKIPAVTWPSKKVLKWLKSKKRVSSDQLEGLEIFLNELQLAQKSEKLEFADLGALSRRSLKLAESLESSFSRGSL